MKRLFEVESFKMTKAIPNIQRVLDSFYGKDFFTVRELPGAGEGKSCEDCLLNISTKGKRFINCQRPDEKPCINASCWQPIPPGKVC
jgi:hypothetical protein